MRILLRMAKLENAWKYFDPSGTVKTLCLFGKLGSESLAVGKGCVVGSLVGYQTLVINENCAVIPDALSPLAHPFAVAPAIGAKQSDGLSGKVAFDRSEERFEFVFFQNLSLIHI